MILYEVGKPYPGVNHMPGQDYTLVEISNHFFDIVCFAADPVPAEIKAWRKGELYYGLYTNSKIPFFIVSIPNWSLDVTINILKLKQENQREEWLNAEGNLINMFLINSRTGILEAMRVIGIKSEIAEDLKDVLEEQIRAYDSMNDIELKIASIQYAMTTEEMIQRTKMNKL